MISLNLRAVRGACTGAASVLAIMAAGGAAADQGAQARIEMPSQSLQAALAALGEEYGVTVVAPGDLVRNKTAPPVYGAFTADEAVAFLLEGSGLAARRSSSGAIMVAYAQRAETGDVARNSLPVAETIIVTGTKKNLSIQKTETSVAVYTEEAVEQQSLFNLEDILLRTANVSTAGGDALNNLSIRGVTLTGVGFTGSGATANVYTDGAPSSFNANQSAVNLWDVAQVEVLRGPQSTVQGRNALSGALVIRTADPEYEFGFKGRILFGNNENTQFSGMVTGPLIEDQLAFRLAADVREIDFGVINQITNARSRFQEATTLRGKLLIEPAAAPGLRVELTASHVDTEFSEFNEAIAPGPLGSPEFAAFDPFGKETFNTRERLEFNDVTRGIVDVQYDFSDEWSLFAIGTIEDTNRDALFGQNGASISRDRVYSGEVRVAFDFDRLSGWVGGYYFDQTAANDILFAAAASTFGIPAIPADASISIDSTRTEIIENYAIFGDLTYELNERISLNVGGRFDWEDFSDAGLIGSVTATPSSCVVNLIVPGFGGLPCAAILPVSNEPPRSADFNAFLPRGSVTYRFDDLRSVSFGVQRGYRAGGAYVRSTPDGLGTDEFDPEFITNYEVALRTQWFDRLLTVNANIFYADWSDQQVTVPGPSGTPFDFEIRNAGSSELYGAEIDATASPFDGLDLFGSLGLVKAEFTDFEFASTGAFQNLAGNSFNSAPTVNFSSGFSYEHGSGFFTSWNVSYSGSQFSDVTNLPDNKVDSYVLVNARIGYRHGPAELVLYADNLLDDRFATRQSLRTVNTRTGSADVDTRGLFVVNDPRLIGVQLQVKL